MLRKEARMTRRQVSDTWESGEPYEAYVGRWSRRVAPLFLRWLGVEPGRQWLDVGCGTGALCAAIMARCAPGSLTGIDPSEGFLACAQACLGGRAKLIHGSATALPLADASVDVVVSGLVLNFIADAPAAVAEMKRVMRPGGMLGAYVWDYGAKMELMRHFWDAAVELDPAARKLDEGVRFPLCRPEALIDLFSEARLAQVRTTAIEVQTTFANFEAYWQPFLGGQGPAPAYAMSLDETARERLRERIRTRLPNGPNGTIPLTARAWAVRATLGPGATRLH
jgi:SAM-dependent methyltransferase